MSRIYLSRKFPFNRIIVLGAWIDTKIFDYWASIFISVVQKSSSTLRTLAMIFSHVFAVTLLNPQSSCLIKFFTVKSQCLPTWFFCNSPIQAGVEIQFHRGLRIKSIGLTAADRGTSQITLYSNNEDKNFPTTKMNRELIIQNWGERLLDKKIYIAGLWAIYYSKRYLPYRNYFSIIWKSCTNITFIS